MNYVEIAKAGNRINTAKREAEDMQTTGPRET